MVEPITTPLKRQVPQNQKQHANRIMLGLRLKPIYRGWVHFPTTPLQILQELLIKIICNYYPFPRRTGKMTLRLVSAPPSFSLFSCRATASTALPPPTPTPTPAPTLISSIPQSPPLTCALHCPHFQSYAPPLLTLIFFSFLKIQFIYIIIAFSGVRGARTSSISTVR